MGITDDKLSVLEDWWIEFTQSKYREKCRGGGDMNRASMICETKIYHSARERGERK